MRGLVRLPSCCRYDRVLPFQLNLPPVLGERRKQLWAVIDPVKTSEKDKVEDSLVYQV